MKITMQIDDMNDVKMAHAFFRDMPVQIDENQKHVEPSPLPQSKPEIQEVLEPELPKQEVLEPELPKQTQVAPTPQQYFEAKQKSETNPIIETKPINKLDSLGYPWDERIHAPSKKRLAKTDEWKLARLISPELITIVRAEYDAKHIIDKEQKSIDFFEQKTETQHEQQQEIEIEPQKETIITVDDMDSIISNLIENKIAFKDILSVLRSCEIQEMRNIPEASDSDLKDAYSKLEAMITNE